METSATRSPGFLFLYALYEQCRKNNGEFVPLPALHLTGARDVHNFVHLSGDFEVDSQGGAARLRDGIEKSPLIQRFMQMAASGETVPPPPRPLLTNAVDWLLDECCRPFDAHLPASVSPQEMRRIAKDNLSKSWDDSWGPIGSREAHERLRHELERAVTKAATWATGHTWEWDADKSSFKCRTKEPGLPEEKTTDAPHVPTRPTDKKKRAQKAVAALHVNVLSASAEITINDALGELVETCCKAHDGHCPEEKRAEFRRRATKYLLPSWKQQMQVYGREKVTNIQEGLRQQEEMYRDLYGEVERSIAQALTELTGNRWQPSSVQYDVLFRAYIEKQNPVPSHSGEPPSSPFSSPNGSSSEPSSAPGSLSSEPSSDSTMQPASPTLSSRPISPESAMESDVRVPEPPAPEGKSSRKAQRRARKKAAKKQAAKAKTRWPRTQGSHPPESQGEGEVQPQSAPTTPSPAAATEVPSVVADCTPSLPAATEVPPVVADCTPPLAVATESPPVVADCETAPTLPAMPEAPPTLPDTLSLTMTAETTPTVSDAIDTPSPNATVDHETTRPVTAEDLSDVAVTDRAPVKPKPIPHTRQGKRKGQGRKTLGEIRPQNTKPSVPPGPKQQSNGATLSNGVYTKTDPRWIPSPATKTIYARKAPPVQSDFPPLSASTGRKAAPAPREMPSGSNGSPLSGPQTNESPLSTPTLSSPAPVRPDPVAPLTEAKSPPPVPPVRFAHVPPTAPASKFSGSPIPLQCFPNLPLVSVPFGPDQLVNSLGRARLVGNAQQSRMFFNLGSMYCQLMSTLEECVIEGIFEAPAALGFVKIQLDHMVMQSPHGTVDPLLYASIRSGLLVFFGHHLSRLPLYDHVPARRRFTHDLDNFLHTEAPRG